MENEDKPQQTPEIVDEAELLRRRDFLKGLKKWSQIVIGGIVLGLSPDKTEAGAWVNSRGGWINGGGGGGWANRGGAWVNGGGGGGGWVNRGGTWANGGGGGWVNRRGGGGWVNAR